MLVAASVPEFAGACGSKVATDGGAASGGWRSDVETLVRLGRAGALPALPREFLHLAGRELIIWRLLLSRFWHWDAGHLTPEGDAPEANADEDRKHQHEAWDFVRGCSLW